MKPGDTVYFHRPMMSFYEEFPVEGIIVKLYPNNASEFVRVAYEYAEYGDKVSGITDIEIAKLNRTLEQYKIFRYTQWDKELIRKLASKREYIMDMIKDYKKLKQQHKENASLLRKEST